MAALNRVKAVPLGPVTILSRLVLRKLVQLIFHLPSFGKLFFRLLKDPRVPPWPKLMPLLILAYWITPLDLLPDFVLGLGQIDDLMALFLGLRFFLKLCPKHVVQEHVQAIAAGR